MATVSLIEAIKNSPDNETEKIIKTSIKHSLKELYRLYFVERNKNFKVLNIFADGTLEISSETYPIDIYDILSDFIQTQKQKLFSGLPKKVGIIEPCLIEASRCLWSRNPKVDTEDVVSKVLTNVVRDYFCSINLPDAFSVSTIDERGKYTSFNSHKYAEDHVYVLLPELLSNGFVKYVAPDHQENWFNPSDPPEIQGVKLQMNTFFSQYGGRGYGDMSDFISFIHYRMISDFMKEYSNRIRAIIPRFPQQVFSQFFSDQNWTPRYQFHNVVFFGVESVSVDGDPQKWKIGRHIGGGSYGKVYEHCPDSKNCTSVMKVSCGHEYNSYDAKREVELAEMAYKLGVSPKIFATRVTETYSIIIMDRMDDTIEGLERKMDDNALDIVVGRVLDYIEILHSNGIVHGDMYFRNIMLKNSSNSQRLANAIVNGDVKVKIVDFGYASTKDDEDAYDFYGEVGILRKLTEIQCETDRSNIFSVMMFYDYYSLLKDIRKFNRNPARSVKRILKKQIELGKDCKKNAIKPISITEQKVVSLENIVPTVKEKVDLFITSHWKSKKQREDKRKEILELIGRSILTTTLNAENPNNGQWLERLNRLKQFFYSQSERLKKA
jgi:tRNA A-37 threonylcarbamoyl transferase component Bud32